MVGQFIGNVGTFCPVVALSALAGKPKGRDKRQQNRWAENDKEIIFELMGIFPLPLRISDIQKKTSIRKSERIRNHLAKLQKNMIVQEVHRGAWRIHPSTFHRESWIEAYEKGYFTPERIIIAERKRRRVSALPIFPKEIRKQVKSHISKMTDDSLDLVVNLTGKYVDKRKKRRLKKEAEIEIDAIIDKAISKTYEMSQELVEEHLQKEVKGGSQKEKFYLVTDTLFQTITHEIPKNVHALDYLFEVCEELLRDFRFDWNYLRNTEYAKHLQALRKLFTELKEEQKISKSWEILREFKDSRDFYPLLQATFHRLIKYYEFLGRDFSKIEKRQIDKYLEIYQELSGHYEKLISLIAALVGLLRGGAIFTYEAARNRSLYQNVRFVQKDGWEIFVSGFDRRMRNAIVHKTYKVDILKERVEFIDRSNTVTLIFKEVQKETRELGALLLILPHVLVSIFCLTILSIKEMLDDLPGHVRP